MNCFSLFVMPVFDVKVDSEAGIVWQKIGKLDNGEITYGACGSNVPGFSRKTR